MVFRAVFFDAGETLVHPHPSFPELFSSILARDGHARDASEVVEAAGVVSDLFSEAARDRLLWTTSPERSRAFWGSVYARMLDALSLPVADGLADTLYSAFTDRANYALFEDVRPTIELLAAEGLLLGIVSNFEAWLELLLDDLEILDRFPVRVISGVEGVEKPDPLIYRLALERAEISPGHVAFVGDNPEFDFDPPAGLGMFPVLLDRRERHGGFEGARIRDLRDLPAVLGLG